MKKVGDENNDVQERLPRKISLPAIEEPEQSNLTEAFENKVKQIEQKQEAFDIEIESSIKDELEPTKQQ